MKEKILVKASDLFLTLGFKSVTMDDIAAEMGISKKTIYSHFSTKLKLVNATTLYVFEKLNDGICTICAGKQNPIQEIFSIKSLVMELLKGEKTSPSYQLRKYYPTVFNSLRHKQFESTNICVHNNLQRGIDQGYYRNNIQKDLVTKFYFNGLMGIQNKSLFPIDEFERSFLIDCYLEYHIRAIATEKGLKILLNILKK